MSISWHRVTRAEFDALSTFTSGHRYDVLEASGSITEYVVNTGGAPVPRAPLMPLVASADATGAAGEVRVVIITPNGKPDERAFVFVYTANGDRVPLAISSQVLRDAFDNAVLDVDTSRNNIKTKLGLIDLIGTHNWNAATLNAGQRRERPVAVTGATPGMFVELVADSSLQGLTMWGDVTAADTLTIYLENGTNAAIDPPTYEFTYNLRAPQTGP